MKKRFNVTGCCLPDRHYMVDITDKLNQIKDMVDNGDYFVINRARQYGKTTTLKLLKKFLQPEYFVIPLDFQLLSNDCFTSEENFSEAVYQEIYKAICNQESNYSDIDKEAILKFKGIKESKFNLRILFEALNCLIEKIGYPIVLFIDEVDQASNNQIFLDFLAQLRAGYLQRDEKSTFQSVILTGVYDIKNIKYKIRPESNHKLNSPWNIATAFKVDMSFEKDAISQMLKEYETDNGLDFNPDEMAEYIYVYSKGYPYLVSAICKVIDENGKNWSKEGFLSAVKEVIKGENNTLYDDMIKHVEENSALSEMLQEILFSGANYPFQISDKPTDIGRMFGFIVECNGSAVIANRIFETQLYNYFIMKEIHKEKEQSKLPDKNIFIENGKLNMDKVMEKFYEYYESLISDKEEKFIENQGRKLFLIFLRPIINGTGNYYVEDASRNNIRTDVIVDYHGEQFIIEMKIWRGEEYRDNGLEQLSDYLDAYKAKKGYLLTFDFRKNKRNGITRTNIKGKEILEVVV